jgi:hypothetical protein
MTLKASEMVHWVKIPFNRKIKSKRLWSVTIFGIENCLSIFVVVVVVVKGFVKE